MLTAEQIIMTAITPNNKLRDEGVCTDASSKLIELARKQTPVISSLAMRMA